MRSFPLTHKALPLPGAWVLTGAQLFDSAVTCVGVDGQEVLVPGDLWVGVPAGRTQHGGRPGPLHHLELGAHVDVREPGGKQVLCGGGGGQEEERTVVNMTLAKGRVLGPWIRSAGFNIVFVGGSLSFNWRLLRKQQSLILTVLLSVGFGLNCFSLGEQGNWD